MSEELTHIIVGDLIEQAVNAIPDERINKPFIAAILVFASHAAALC